MEYDLKLSAKQQLLLNQVMELHKGQKRKYTGEPYHVHCIDVAWIIDHHIGEGSYNKGFLTEVALLHDVLEDQYHRCDELEMVRILKMCGYTYFESMEITMRVIELTDVYVGKRASKMNREQRKCLEAERLWEISSVAQTVKYADLMDNTTSIVELAPGFAKTYLLEKDYILSGMNSGDSVLYFECKQSLNKSLNKLKLES